MSLSFSYIFAAELLYGE